MQPLFWVYIAPGVVALWLVWTYNRLVTLRYRAKEALSDIDVQLKRRFDLIPNLVEAVKGYMAHEKGVLEKVTAARASVASAKGNPLEREQAENALTNTLKTLFAVAENYPDLKANQNFLQLQKELGDTEDKIQASRRFYNTTVMTLNTAEQTFPGNLIASTFSFNPMDLFELTAADAAASEPGKVQF